MKSGTRLSGDRQEFAVPPQVLRSRGNLGARQPHCVVVVDRFERTKTLIADVNRLRRKICSAQVTLQAEKRAHTASAMWQRSPSQPRPPRDFSAPSARS